MKTKKKTSIQSKTLVYLLFLTVVIIIVLWGSQILLFDFYYEKSQIKNMDYIANLAKTVDSFSQSSTLEEIAYQNDVCVAVIIPPNSLTTYNISMNGCALKEDSNVQSLMAEFIKSNDEFKAFKFVNEKANVSALLYGIKNDGNYTFLYSNLKDLSDVTLLIKKLTMHISIVGILGAIVLSIFLSRKLTKPIMNITDKARKLGKGDTFVKFDESDIKEIDDLSKALTKAQNEMLKTDEYRRDLMANVSHDLKTPLTMIKAYAEMIQDISYKDPKKMNEHLDIIVDETDRLTLLVNDILDLSRLEATKDEFVIEEFDLTKEIKKIVNKYQIIKETEKYKINVLIPDKMMVKADKRKINQVIYNLVNNAINYTGVNKTVTIKATNEKKDYLIEIIDTGKGIKENEIPNIWHKYYKNDKNHKRNVVSTGLGLYIVRLILEQHHFEYGVKSKINEGSTFYFKIKK